jgi:hypothetical protein
MSITDQVLRDLEQRAINDGVGLDELDPRIAGALGAPVECLYAYLRVTFAAQRWRLNDTDRPCDPTLALVPPTTKAG